ncbi:hypothetical protein MLD38_026924 [Melastoma candidum]|uniref:Uncharacterized protein n=1 Tax=Melastoma candidum TaxID=119954 RepID=A0ACB9P050_9MYRT|nr:hypothetical protein MLD38_026924 [Melastoma candidum]
MTKPLQVLRSNVSNPKLWIVIGIGVAGVVILAESRRRRKRKGIVVEDFGAFFERFELFPHPQPPPPAPRQALAGLTFAVQDNFDVAGHVTGFGCPDWKRTHEAVEKTAVAVTLLLKNGAKCVGSTVMGEFAFGMTGENVHHGTPVNVKASSCVPGGSSSGSAVAVAAEIVDFALGSDTTGCVRIPASFCGILGYRPSHGVVSTVGILPNSQSLDAVGWFAHDPSILHRVGHSLLKLNAVEPKRLRQILFADDLFELSNVPKHKSVHVITKAAEKLSGYHPPKHMNIGKRIASNVPSLKAFYEDSTNLKNGISSLKTLSSVMLTLQRYEFKINHEEWFTSVKPKLGPSTADLVSSAMNSCIDGIKSLYKVRTEMRTAFQSLLKDNAILVMPTVADGPLPINSRKRSFAEFRDRALTLLSISSMSGCCQVSIPIGTHDGHPISVSFITYHGGDKFLLDTVLDMYPSILEQVSIASVSVPPPDINGDMDTSELLKEKGNAAYKGRQWNKAVTYYTEAINLNGTNTTYYCNRAAAYLELGCFQQAEEDCNKAISLDRRNVKAYLRRGTARESLLRNQEALLDFKQALVYEPQNKAASTAEKRLQKLLR